MNPVELAILSIAGAVLGSFANVLIYRLPHAESIVSPGSRCPQCRTPIHPWDNIPILSYFLLHGRCRQCGSRISPRYPLVEGLMALLFVAVRIRFPEPFGLDRFPWAFGSAVLLVFLLVVITFIDLDHQLILNRLTYPGIVAGLLLAVAQGRPIPALVTGVGAAGLILAIVVLSRGGMGGGDVKLAGLNGVFLAWPSGAVALFLGFLIGGIVGIGLLALRIRGRKDAVPFGPALAAGALAALFWGEAIARWYWP